MWHCAQVCELPIAMLACARIGAVHNVVFAGFSSESLAQRLQDCKCAAAKTYVTTCAWQLMHARGHYCCPAGVLRA